MMLLVCFLYVEIPPVDIVVSYRTVLYCMYLEKETEKAYNCNEKFVYVKKLTISAGPILLFFKHFYSLI
jgi:hypothetical protein